MYKYILLSLCFCLSDSITTIESATTSYVYKTRLLVNDYLRCASCVCSKRTYMQTGSTGQRMSTLRTKRKKKYVWCEKGYNR